MSVKLYADTTGTGSSNIGYSIHQINHFPADKVLAISPVDSFINLLNNWGLNITWMPH